MADSQGPLPKVPEERKLKWYDNEPPDLSAETRRLLENYSKISPDAIESHLRTIVSSPETSTSMGITR